MMNVELPDVMRIITKNMEGVSRRGNLLDREFTVYPQPYVDPAT